MGKEKNAQFQTFNLEHLLSKGSRKKKKMSLNSQSFTFVCGVQLNTFFVTLTRGQFVEITCGTSPIVLRVGCGNQFTQKVATYHLLFGQAVQVTCI